MPTILDIDNVSKRFQGLQAIDTLSFTLNSNEILGLIGPNGAGKSTLVNMISGTMRPTQGEILFEGKPINNIPSYKRARLGISRTFQIMNPFPGLSMLDNVAVGALFGREGGCSNLADARKEAYHWLDFVGIAHHADKRADELTGPECKRLELAKALATRPKLLLLDEVMAGLNHVEIEQVIEIIKKIRDSGVSILVIEHVMKAIKSLCERLIVIQHGVKIAEGKTDEVLQSAEVITAYLGKRKH
jgi:branched-chain amino acid transport system ATP-binding protein